MDLEKMLLKRQRELRDQRRFTHPLKEDRRSLMERVEVISEKAEAILDMMMPIILLIMMPIVAVLLIAIAVAITAAMLGFGR